MVKKIYLTVVSAALAAICVSGSAFATGFGQYCHKDYRPVCVQELDGSFKTYSNRCFADQFLRTGRAVRFLYQGQCRAAVPALPSNYQPAPQPLPRRGVCPRDYRPVCATDRQYNRRTYSNRCVATNARAWAIRNGRCTEDDYRPANTNSAPPLPPRARNLRTTRNWQSRAVKPKPRLRLYRPAPYPRKRFVAPKTRIYVPLLPPKRLKKSTRLIKPHMRRNRTVCARLPGGGQRNFSSAGAAHKIRGARILNRGRCPMG